MKEIQLYFDFDGEVIVDQWTRNTQRCFRSLPEAFNLRNMFADHVIDNWPSSIPVIPMDLIYSK